MAMGAQSVGVRPKTRLSSLFWFVIIDVLIFANSFWLAAAAPAQEKESEALLKFRSSLANAEGLSNWNSSTPPCSGNKGNWLGVLCMNGYVWGLQLENMNLRGQIDVHALSPLPFLRTLSFMGNEFEGVMPDWRKIGALKSLYLSNNKFSGQINPDAFKGMTSLKKVHMANNRFSGPLPTSLESPKLIELRLENNHFTGPIPRISSDNLKALNVSNNQLEGPIPTALAKMDPACFLGNKALCGKPLQTECVGAPVVSPAKAKPSSAGSSPVGLILACAVLALILIAMLVVLTRCSRRRSQTPQLGRAVPPPGVVETSREAAGESKQAGKAPAKKSEQQPGKLSFVREDRQKFDLQDLMRASAEVLGSGNFGASYKAVLVDGEALVVKRFKQMNNVAREDFQEHMRRIGRLKHPNLLPLVAYLYRREEKLLVFDYVPNGSLATHLHGKHSAALNWGTRLKIIKGVGKGLLYLQNEVPTLTVPHGHLISSNVLLDKNFNPLLMDYALTPVVNTNQLQNVLFAYKSPEYATHCHVSRKTDVWCLGILILETLSGRYLVQGSSADLAAWINGIAAEEYANVFDKEMEASQESRRQMEKLLQVGIACCQEDPDKRWDLEEAIRQIEAIQHDDHDQLLISIST